MKPIRTVAYILGGVAIIHYSIASPVAIAKDVADHVPAAPPVSSLSSTGDTGVIYRTNTDEVISRIFDPRAPWENSDTG